MEVTTRPTRLVRGHSDEMQRHYSLLQQDPVMFPLPPSHEDRQRVCASHGPLSPSHEDRQRVRLRVEDPGVQREQLCTVRVVCVC